jgi:hypothetical protein
MLHNTKIHEEGECGHLLRKEFPTPQKNVVRVAVNPASLSLFKENNKKHTHRKKKELCHEMVPFTFFF